MPLPPGPREPAALQTVEWIARPTAFLRRCQARHGEPFTVRVAWADAPVVLVSEPAQIKRIFTAGHDVLHGGASSTVLEPFAGPSSILLLDGPEHLRQRRLMLPSFHGDALQEQRPVIAALAAAEVDAWQPGEPLRTHRRMQSLTLDVILRAVFGPQERPELRGAIRRALDMTTSLPRLVAMSLVRHEAGPWGTFRRAVAGVDALLYRELDREAPDGSILAVLQAARHEDGSPPTRAELRDQVVTLLAAGHETTAGSLAWALERLARHPDVLARMRAGNDEYLEAVVKEVLRVRPVLSIAARKVAAPYEVGGYALPPGVHVAPCIYLAHRRPESWADPTAFRPERFLDGQPRPYTYLPFGGGVRRCVGAAFAMLEMKEVLRAVAQSVRLRPDRSRGERMRRGSVTLMPTRGGVVVPEPLQPHAAPVSLFCRHNRLTANCPICSRELQSELKAKAPPSSRPRGTSRAAKPTGASARRSGVVTRRIARAADDGYRNPLAPGLRATADAERLAAALAAAAGRLEPPGPYPEIATEPDREQATWLAFLLALAGPEAPEVQQLLLAARPAWSDGDVGDLPADRRRTAEAYRAWAARAGSQAAAFEGDASWTPERRFGRVLERLALPGFGRARRYDLLTALGAAGLYELSADKLHVGKEDDATTVAAKRLLVSGDTLLLERRARELADACELPIAALDRGLAVWNQPTAAIDLDGEPPAAIRAALRLG